MMTTKMLNTDCIYDDGDDGGDGDDDEDAEENIVHLIQKLFVLGLFAVSYLKTIWKKTQNWHSICICIGDCHT